MKYKILLISCYLSIAAQANFNFGECQGSGTFEQEIIYYAGYYENVATVGEIPAGIKGLKVSLISDKDVDIRLYGENEDKIVHWPYGILKKSDQETKSYQGVNITYSGYNGEGGEKGHEYIEVNGTTAVTLTMKAFGYRAGYATVNYSWIGKEGCSPKDSGEDSFTQTLLKDSTSLVGTIPPHVNNLEINLTSTTDIDIQLYAEDGTAIASWKPTGLMAGASKQSLIYHDMNITWSGYNGSNGNLGNEYITVTGETSEMLIMKVFGYESGEADVTYSWGDNKVKTIFDSFNVGFGGSPAFPFLSDTGGEHIWVSAKNLILDDNIENNGYYNNIKAFDSAAFSKLQNNLKKSKFIVLWLTKGWKESQFNLESLQELMYDGYIPVFSYWYFGDRLLNGIPNTDEKIKYEADNLRVAQFLTKLNGQKMLIMEPEFNKPTVLKSNATQHEFASIISTAIDIIKEKNSALLFTLSMMDIGSRGIYNTMEKCGYENCSLGDKYAWSRSDIVYNDLIDKLDFISFHQMMGQFARDYENPGGWHTPNARGYSDDEIGVDFLADRISNMSKYLHDKYHKPIFMPYVCIATATWEDLNGDKNVTNNEVDYLGWEDKATNFYRRLAELRPTLKKNGMFGFAPLALFDHPRHDYGEYQFFMQNEYHLGIIGSSAKDEIDGAPHGDLYFKQDIIESIFNPY